MINYITSMHVSFFGSLVTVCKYSSAGLLPNSEPSREEYSQGGGGRGDSYGERAQRAGSYRNQERTHCYKGR